MLFSITEIWIDNAKIYSTGQIYYLVSLEYGYTYYLPALISTTHPRSTLTFPFIIMFDPVAALVTSALRSCIPVRAFSRRQLHCFRLPTPIRTSLPDARSPLESKRHSLDICLPDVHSPNACSPDFGSPDA